MWGRHAFLPACGPLLHAAVAATHGVCGSAPTVDEFGAGAAFHGEGASREPARVPCPQEGVELSVGIAVVVVIAQH